MPRSTPTTQAERTLLEQADEISATLHALGLAHVPVHVASPIRGGTASEAVERKWPSRQDVVTARQHDGLLL